MRRLREAATEHGLGNPDVRRRAWPLLAGAGRDWRALARADRIAELAEVIGCAM